MQLACRALFAVSHEWHRLRFPRRLVPPQQNKRVVARAGHAANVGRRLGQFWAANVVRSIVRMVATYVDTLKRLQTLTTSGRHKLDFAIFCAIVKFAINPKPNDNSKSNPYVDVAETKLFQRISHFGT